MEPTFTIAPPGTALDHRARSSLRCVEGQPEDRVESFLRVLLALLEERHLDGGVLAGRNAPLAPVAEPAAA